MTAPAPLDLPAVLDDLERAHAAATPGPWRQDDEFPQWFGTGESTYIGTAPSGDDAALIVAAVNAVPTLIAELRKRDAALREFAELEASYPLGSDVPVYRIGRILAALSPESVQS